MRYQYSKTVRDTDQLHSELLASGLPGFTGVLTSGDNLFIEFTNPLTNAQQTTLNNLITAHIPDKNFTRSKLIERTKDRFTEIEDEGTKTDRSIALTAMDEINLLRDWITQFKLAVANAGTLAALKTNVAALPNLPQRTPAQVKAAVINRMDTTDSD